MIVKINLLPWRDELKIQEENKVKRVLALSCLFGAILAGILVFLVQEELDTRQLRLNIINAEFTQLGNVEAQMNERKSQTERLKQQLGVLQKLSAQRSEVVSLMEKFSSVTPQDAFIISLAFTLDNISFNALAKDRDVLAVHLDSLDNYIGPAPIPPHLEVLMDGNRVVSYSVEVKTEQNKGAK
ncbi:PilN domain-containing protein [Wohlfahrtiimonas larvae]|uniref:PilN domain-containing protein n=1 Tax=Wohlfahrtiimonas larvae TaxID=1157986 RepID=A0ABP9MRA2_9GAMM|nr:hypothetical protein [Wohlfahrtiimonas larvae]